MQIFAGVVAPSFDISGGQETVTVGGFKYCIFTSSGTLTLTMPGNVSFCTVGGGGGAGFNLGAGGGGAELDLFASFALTANATITIGIGGVASTTTGAFGTNGGASDVVQGSTLQTALGGGGGGSYSNTYKNGQAGGSGGGGNFSTGTGGGASGSNTNVGASASAIGNFVTSGGGGGATAAGTVNTGIGGQGYALSSIDANLTAANFPTTLTGKTHVSSGGGGMQYSTTASGGVQVGGTNAGNGGFQEYVTPTVFAATSPTSYGCGGGGDGGFNANVSTSGFAGVVIARIAL
jgi:hypothetical protein